MRYIVVSVFDKAVAAYQRPLCVRAEGEAIRMFLDECKSMPSSGSNPMLEHPEHFSLYVLGTFDDASGGFDVEKDMPRKLADATQARQV